MYNPHEDILTHPDFTEVNKTWDKISEEHREKINNKKTKVLTAVFVGSFVATIIYLDYRKNK